MIAIAHDDLLIEHRLLTTLFNDGSIHLSYYYDNVLSFDPCIYVILAIISASPISRRDRYISRNRHRASKMIEIKPATIHDVPLILQFIKGLAAYEKLSHQVVATEEDIRDSLFGQRPAAEVILAYDQNEPVGFALFFHNYSTFLGRPGLYLEDLFVMPEHRGKGYGRALLGHLAKIARARNCGRMEWAVLDWNEPAINFYKSIGATALDEWKVFRLTDNALESMVNED